MMATKVNTRLTLAYPPSANRYWRVFHGTVVRSEEATRYKTYVMLLCNQLEIAMLRGEVKVSLTFYRPQKSGDLDNRIKIVLDALQGQAYADDKQIVEIHALRMDDKLNPRVEVEIEEG
jgi:Holliday junction resolvase RusA-like endonuclease